MNKEKILREVPDFPGYFVNDIGEIWSNKKYNGNINGELRKRSLAKDQKGYLIITLNKNNTKHMRKVARLVIDAPPNKQVDHRRNGWGVSKYKGVSWHCGLEKWRAVINVNLKRISLGCFVIEEQAAIAYNNAALKHHGDFAKLNII